MKAIFLAFQPSHTCQPSRAAAAEPRHCTVSAEIRARFFPPSRASRVTRTARPQERVPCTLNLRRVPARFPCGPHICDASLPLPSASASCPGGSQLSPRQPSASPRQPLRARHVADQFHASNQASTRVQMGAESRFLLRKLPDFFSKLNI